MTQKSLFKSSAVVGLMTLISRVLGLVRDVVLAAVLGAGASADVYLFAIKIPNFLRRLFAEGAFAQAFVPVFSEYITNKEKKDAKVLIDKVFGTLSVILTVITLLAVVFSPVVVFIFGSGFITQPAKLELASFLVKITFPYLLFVSLTACAGSILNALGTFSVPAFTPVLLNLSILFAAFFIAPHTGDPAIGLAIGVFIGGLLQLVFQVPFLIKNGFYPRLSWGWRDSGVSRILKLMGPALFGVSVGQINLLIDTQIASFLKTGSISWLYYSDRLLEFPLGIFGIAIATVILPGLSKDHAKQSSEAYSQKLDWGLRCIFAIGLPSMIALALMAEPLLIVLFQYGTFSAQDAYMASISLMSYAFGLLSLMAVKILAPGFYGKQDTKTPVKAAIIAMVSNSILNFILVWPFGYFGLAIATSISASVNAILLFKWLVDKKIYTPSEGWRLFLSKLFLTNSLLVALILILVPNAEFWVGLGAVSRAWHLAIYVLGGVLVYVISSYILGVHKGLKEAQKASVS